MPKISAEAAANRRAHILEAARHCFAEHGIHVSVDKICAKAGISKGAFYVYFDSKDAAIEALAEDHKRVLAEFASLGSVEDLLRKLAELTTDRSTASTRLELETWTHALRSPPLLTALEQNVGSMRQVLAINVGALAGSSSKRNSSPPPAVIAEILTIFSLGLIASSALGTQRTTHSAERALKALVSTLMKGDGSVHERR